MAVSCLYEPCKKHVGDSFAAGPFRSSSKPLMVLYSRAAVSSKDGFGFSFLKNEAKLSVSEWNALIDTPSVQIRISRPADASQHTPRKATSPARRVFSRG